MQRNKIINKAIFTLSLICFSHAAGFASTDSLYINEFLAKNATVYHDNYSQYDDWIELYNKSNSTIDIGGLYISDDLGEPAKWQIPEGSIETEILPGGFLLLWADNDTTQGVLHLGFKLSGDGEQIGLFAADGHNVIDSLSFGPQDTDISFGRKPDGSDNWIYFSDPTPGDSNWTEPAEEKAEAPEFSKEAGFYLVPFDLEIEAEIDSTIFYTINGSDPDKQSIKYQGAILIDSTSVIRARVILDELRPSDIITHSYIFDDSLHLPVFSLVTDPENLWGSQGIYDHRYEDWEKTLHVEFFDEDHELQVSQNAGIKIHAPDGRAQQSLRLYARGIYGTSQFDYPFFDDNKISSFKRLILRNGGNDGLQIGGRNTHFRDLFTNILYRERSFHNAMSCGRAVNVFLNGEYWGIYNLRERQDKYYIESNFGDTNLDFLEREAHSPNTRKAIEGDWDHYNQMEDFAKNNDLSLDSNYTLIKTQTDVDDYSEYYIFEIFVANRDWLSNNVRFWRPRSGEGLWRWALWDTEYGMGRDPNYAHGRPEWNTLTWATAPGGGWSGTGDNTILIRNLLENESFKNRFINRYADLLNTSFRPESTHRLIDKLKENIEDDAPFQVARWGRGTVQEWYDAVDSLKFYFTRRHYYAAEHIKYKFGLDTTYNLFLSVQPPCAGSVKLNTLTLDTFPWQGEYFKDVPLELSAIPSPDYKFSSWQSDSILSNNINLFINPDSDLTLSAHFVPDTTAKVIINEINYNSNDNFNSEDWVELYNLKKWPVNISGWVFKDDKDEHSYIFPQNTFIDSMGYLVLCKDIDQFRIFFPDVDNCVGSFGGDDGFGLSKDGDQARLFGHNGELIDKVSFDDKSPWPEAADGDGYTLELINPLKDNSLAQSWLASDDIGGTPGRINSVYTAINRDAGKKPVSFFLYQNYPNPFNPSTTISYQLSAVSHVELNIFNILGQKVATLVSEKQKAGLHRFIFNGNRLPSGLYFFELKTEKGQRFVRKGILIK